MGFRGKKKTIDNASASVEQDQTTRMCIGEYGARSDSTYVQADLYLHSANLVHGREQQDKG